MLAIQQIHSLNDLMPQLEEDPSDFNEVLELIPLRCRTCKYGQIALGLAWSFDFSTGAFWPTVEDMREICGRGEEVPNLGVKDPDTEAGIIDTEAGEMLSMPLPVSGDKCPLEQHAEGL